MSAPRSRGGDALHETSRVSRRRPPSRVVGHWAWLLFLVLTCACRNGSEPVVVFAAASMGPTLEALVGSFAAANPGSHLEVELSSSRAACIKLTEQGRAADLVLSADSELLRELLVPKYATELTRFASNRLVLAARPSSPTGKRLAAEPWQHVAATPGLRVGIADPGQAPVGARTVAALRANDTVETDASLRIGAALLERLKGPAVRPDVSKLIAPIETGELDAAFIYESEAKQYGFAYALLNARIDGSTTTFYAAAVPRNAPHPGRGEALLALLLSDKGRKVAARHYLSMLEAPIVEGEAR